MQITPKNRSPLAFLKARQAPLVAGTFLWGGGAAFFFEIGHFTLLLSAVLAIFPAWLAALQLKRFSHAKSETQQTVKKELIQGLEEKNTVPERTPEMENFLKEFSAMLQAQKSFLHKTASFSQAADPSLGVHREEIMALSGDLRTYGKLHRAFIVWQEYKKSVLEMLGEGLSTFEETPHQIYVSTIRYRLAKRELTATYPEENQIVEAVAEIDFFLEAIKQREKELRALTLYLEKATEDGIWLSNAKRQKLKEYEEGQKICQLQLQKDADEVINNLEAIFTAL